MASWNPSLGSWKGFLLLIVGVSIAMAILTQTEVGRQLQGGINSAVGQVPV